MKKFPNYLFVGEMISKKGKSGEVTLSTPFEKERDKRIEHRRITATQEEIEHIRRNNRVTFKPTYIPTIVSYQNKIEMGYDEIIDALMQFDNLLLFEVEDACVEDSRVETQQDTNEQNPSGYLKQKKKKISLDKIIGKELTPNIFKK